MSGNYKSRFNRYKRNLRWKRSLRKNAAWDHAWWADPAMTQENAEDSYGNTLPWIAQALARADQELETGMSPEEIIGDLGREFQAVVGTDPNSTREVHGYIEEWLNYHGLLQNPEDGAVPENQEEPALDRSTPQGW